MAAVLGCLAESVGTVMQKGEAMPKEFHVTGTCIPEKHYMVDVSGRVKRIVAERQDWFGGLGGSFPSRGRRVLSWINGTVPFRKNFPWRILESASQSCADSMAEKPS
nr:hypothetical protein [uncultured Acetatifactor sp.]